MNGVNKAINAVGGIRALSEKLGVSYEAVRQWKTLGVIPQGNVFEVEDATGVSCFELNPCVYPQERFKQAS